MKLLWRLVGLSVACAVCQNAIQQEELTRALTLLQQQELPCRSSRRGRRPRRQALLSTPAIARRHLPPASSTSSRAVTPGSPGLSRPTAVGSGPKRTKGLKSFCHTALPKQPAARSTRASRYSRSGTYLAISPACTRSMELTPVLQRSNVPALDIYLKIKIQGSLAPHEFRTRIHYKSQQSRETSSCSHT